MHEAKNVQREVDGKYQEIYNWDYQTSLGKVWENHCSENWKPRWGRGELQAHFLLIQEYPDFKCSRCGIYLVIPHFM